MFGIFKQNKSEDFTKQGFDKIISLYSIVYFSSRRNRGAVVKKERSQLMRRIFTRVVAVAAAVVNVRQVC